MDNVNFESFSVNPLEAGLQILVGFGILILGFLIYYAFNVVAGKANPLGAKIMNFSAQMEGQRLQTSQLLIALFKAMYSRECEYMWANEALSNALLQSNLWKSLKTKLLSRNSSSDHISWESYSGVYKGKRIIFLVKYNGQLNPNYHISPSGGDQVINLEMVGELHGNLQDLVEKIIQEFSIEYRNTTEKDNKSYYYTIVPGPGGLETQRRLTTSLKPYSDGLKAGILDNCEISFQNKKYGVSISGLIAAVVKNLTKFPVNGIFFGKAGTGKTSLLRAIAYYISKYRPQDKVVIIDSTILTNNDLRLQLLRLVEDWKSQFEEEKAYLPEDKIGRVILLLDEADNALRLNDNHQKTEKNQFLLDLMDGINSGPSGVAIFMTANLEYQDIDPAFLRPNRSHLKVHFKELTVEQRLQVSNFVKENLEKGFIFDQEKFEELKFCTTADIFGCVMPKEVADYLAGFETALLDSPEDLDEELAGWKEEVDSEIEEKEGENPEEDYPLSYEDALPGFTAKEIRVEDLRSAVESPQVAKVNFKSPKKGKKRRNR